MNFLKENGLGLLVCLMIAIPCHFLGKAFPIVGGPVFAILIGMVLGFARFPHGTFRFHY